MLGVLHDTVKIPVKGYHIFTERPKDEINKNYS